ncbi:hypothetical protein M422DRAFT_130017, partial [Sphaerobolus stellatus SS14]
PCMPGTRRNILASFEDWLYDDMKPNILFISGSPGAGKSAIAAGLVLHLQEIAPFRIKKSVKFFFKRDSKYFSKPSNVWKTIAYRLAIINADIGTYLEKYLKDNPSYMDDVHRSMDFKNLIIPAFQSIPAERKAHAPCIIIDALDEAEVSDEQHIFLQSLAEWANLLPEFKLVVTSRNHADIQAVLGACSQPLPLPTGQAVDYISTQDIHTFLEESLKQ